MPADPLKAFLEHHGFNSLLARLGAGAAKAVVAAATAPAAARPEPEAPRLNTTPAIDRSQYETVTTEADRDRWIAAAYAEGVLRSEERRGGEDGASTFRSRRSAYT